MSACSAEEEQNGVPTDLNNRISQAPPPPPDFSSPSRTDPACQAELQQARAEARQGQLTYYLLGRFPYASDLDTLLSEQDIGFVYEPMPCTGEGLCYAYYMDSVITSIHGFGFISRLKHAAHRRFLSQWRTRRYGPSDADVAATSSVGDVNTYITARLPRPQGWDPLPKKDSTGDFAQRQYISGEFTIDSTGQIMGIEWSDANIKDSNRRHLPYFRREITRLLHTTGPWQPARLAGHKVACYEFLDVTLNPEL